MTDLNKLGPRDEFFMKRLQDLLGSRNGYAAKADTLDRWTASLDRVNAATLDRRRELFDFATKSLAGLDEENHRANIPEMSVVNADPRRRERERQGLPADASDLVQLALRRHIEECLKALDVLRAISGRQESTNAARDIVIVLTGAGADLVDVFNDAIVITGDGDDVVSVFHRGTVDAGAGNDRISGYSELIADGGDGDDIISSYGNSTMYGGAGNDVISGYDHVNADGGTGDDVITLYDDVTVSGGDGDDYISTYSRASISGGAGADRIVAGEDSTLDGGSGDDLISTSDRSTVRGGAGDDFIHVGIDSVIHFGRGDGQDFVHSMAPGVTIDFGDVSSDDVDLSVNDDGHIVLSIRDTGDSITLGSAYNMNENPRIMARTGLAFGDGSVALADFFSRHKGIDISS